MISRDPVFVTYEYIGYNNNNITSNIGHTHGFLVTYSSSDLVNRLFLQNITKQPGLLYFYVYAINN